MFSRFHFGLIFLISVPAWSASALFDISLQDCPENLRGNAYLEYECARINGKLRTANRLLSILKERCLEKQEGDEAQCALALSDSLQLARFWERGRISERLHEAIQKTENGGLSDEDLRQWRARLFSTLPNWDGRDFKKSIVAYEFLGRSERLGRVGKFHRAETFYWQGNTERARELAPAPDKAFQHSIDGAWQGLTFGFVADARYGLGVRSRLTSYQFPSETFAVSLNADLSERRRGAGLNLQSEPILSGNEIVFSAILETSEDRFYGFGSSSDETNESRVFVQQGDVDVGLAKDFADGFRAQLGWRFSHDRVALLTGKTVAGVTYQKDENTHGPRARVQYSTLDHEKFARAGVRLSADLWVVSDFLGNVIPFERWQIGYEHHIGGGFRWHPFWGATWTGTTGSQVPFAHLPRLGSTVPGFPEFRYRDRHTFESFAAVEWSPSYLFSVVPFLGAGSASFDASSALQGSWKMGGGVQGRLPLGRGRAPSFRISVSHFGEKFYFQTDLCL